MRVFLAGASGVIGLRLIPLLTADGHEVAGMTRSPEKTAALQELGAEPVVCDVFDADALARAVTAFGPELVMHQLTDLPDQVDQIPEFAARNNRIRTEGTRNLVAAAQTAGATGRTRARSAGRGRRRHPVRHLLRTRHVLGVRSGSATASNPRRGGRPAHGRAVDRTVRCRRRHR